MHRIFAPAKMEGTPVYHSAVRVIRIEHHNIYQQVDIDKSQITSHSPTQDHGPRNSEFHIA